MKKLLALGILATALPLVMQQNTSNKDVTNVLNDVIEEYPDLCALGYETFEGATVLCEQIDFTQIGTNSKYPTNGKYVLGKDISLTSYRTHNISFNGTIDGRTKKMTFTNRIETFGDNDTDHKIALFSFVTTGASFSNLEIIHANSSYSGRTARTDYGSLGARLIVNNGEVKIDNVKVTTNLTNSNAAQANYGSLFGYAEIGTTNSTSKSVLSITNSDITSAASMTYTAGAYGDGSHMGGLIGQTILKGKGQFAGSINVEKNTINSTNRTSESTSTYSGGLFGTLNLTNTSSTESRTAISVNGNKVTHRDTLGAVTTAVGSYSYNSGALVGKKYISDSEFNYSKNIISNTVSLSSTLYRVDAGGAFGYVDASGASKVNGNDNQVKLSGTFTTASTYLYIGGIAGINVNADTTITNVRDTYLDVTINAAQLSNSAVTGGIIGYDNTGTSARNNYDGIVIVGEITNQGIAQLAVAGAIAYFNANGSNWNFKNILVANSVIGSGTGTTYKYVGDVFGRMAGNNPTNENAYFVTENTTSQFDVVKKEEITFEFLTSKYVPVVRATKGMGLNMDVWQIQPYTQIISDSGEIQLFLRIDSRVESAIIPDNGSEWAPVIDLDKFVRQQSINWWFIVGIAAVLGFTFWLYTWNKNRRRYN